MNMRTSQPTTSQQDTTQTPSSEPGPGQPDTKEMIYVASGLLVLAIGIGGLLMYAESEPVPATASQEKASVRVTSTAHMAPGFDATDPEPTAFDPMMASSQPVVKETMTSPITEPGGTFPLEGTDVYFEFNRWTLSEEAKKAIHTQFENSPDEWTGTLRIVGHTDAQGPDAYNRTLGLKRAQSVKAYLTSLGIPEEDIHVETMGEDGPVCQEETPSCFEHNRRAHVAFVPAAISDEEDPQVAMTPVSLTASAGEEMAPSEDDLQPVPSDIEVALQEEVRKEVIISEPLISAESLH